MRTRNPVPKPLIALGSAGITICALSSLVSAQCIILNAGASPYHQDFNTLASSGTSSVTPTGWTFFEGGGSADGLYRASDGTFQNGDVYSFGAANEPERAFGTIHGNSLVPRIGACFLNNTGSGIHRVDIAYAGEQWSRGDANRPDRIEFEYSVNATDLNSGIWMPVGALDLESPNNGPFPGPLDGNAAANRVQRFGVLTDMGVPDGSTFWIRWIDESADGVDDGLGIDDFVLTTGTMTSVPTVSSNSRMAAFPNPSASSFRISYRLEGTGRAELAIFDASGRLVRAIASGVMGAGERDLEWDATDGNGARLAPGTYFVRLQEGGRVERAKLVVVR